MRSGLLDTSVVISIDEPGLAPLLPEEMLISAITAAELAAGPALAATPTERAARAHRLRQVEAAFAPLPFDANAARSYALVVAAIARRGRSPRSRIADLLIAATAHARSMALYTRNPADLAGLQEMIEIVPV